MFYVCVWAREREWVYVCVCAHACLHALWLISNVCHECESPNDRLVMSATGKKGEIETSGLWLGFHGGPAVKNLPTMQETQETQVWSLGWEDPLEDGMGIPSSILTWRIPWTEEPGRLWSMGFQRVGHSWSNWAYTVRSVTGEEYWV